MITPSIRPPQRRLVSVPQPRARDDGQRRRGLATEEVVAAHERVSGSLVGNRRLSWGTHAPDGCVRLREIYWKFQHSTVPKSGTSVAVLSLAPIQAGEEVTGGVGGLDRPARRASSSRCRWNKEGKTMRALMTPWKGTDLFRREMDRVFDDPGQGRVT